MLCHCDEGSNRKTLVKNYSSQVRRGLDNGCAQSITLEMEVFKKLF
jgi:hypothetical protein